MNPRHPVVPLVVPKRRLGMRPAKRRFAPLINPPNSGTHTDGEIRQAPLGNDRTTGRQGPLPSVLRPLTHSVSIGMSSVAAFCIRARSSSSSGISPRSAK